jgi:hypothetical protein
MVGAACQFSEIAVLRPLEITGGEAEFPGGN